MAMDPERADVMRPNPARIYDYVLGGSHNFEADRIAGDQILKLLPEVAHGFKLNRWFMFQAMEVMSEEGFTCFLDLASGLPTQRYIHDLAPTARVLYNDRDPVTVAYGREIIGTHPLARYAQEDIANVPAILEVAEEHFQGERRVGIFLIGVAYFLSEDVLQRTLDSLYAWAAPGSQLAMSFLTINNEHPEVNEISARYAKMGAAMYSRTPDEIRGMLKGWHIQEPGIQRLHEWVATPDWYEGSAATTDLYDGYAVLLGK
jgi:O-methyltransferase involved in polyketide biosynthesis